MSQPGSSPLDIKFGFHDTRRIVIHHDGDFETLEAIKDKRATTFTRGVLSNWTFLMVRTSISGKTSRIQIVRPDSFECVELSYGEFYVTGQARLAHTINNPTQVSKAWKTRNKTDFSESYL